MVVLLRARTAPVVATTVAAVIAPAMQAAVAAVMAPAMLAAVAAVMAPVVSAVASIVADFAVAHPASATPLLRPRSSVPSPASGLLRGGGADCRMMISPSKGRLDCVGGAASTIAVRRRTAPVVRARGWAVAGPTRSMGRVRCTAAASLPFVRLSWLRLLLRLRLRMRGRCPLGRGHRRMVRHLLVRDIAPRRLRVQRLKRLQQRCRGRRPGSVPAAVAVAAGGSAGARARPTPSTSPAERGAAWRGRFRTAAGPIRSCRGWAGRAGVGSY